MQRLTARKNPYRYIIIWFLTTIGWNLPAKAQSACSSWQQVGAANFTGFPINSSNLVIDKYGVAYMAFTDVETLYVMKNSGTGWVTTGDLIGVSGVINNVSMAIDGNGNPCVAAIMGYSGWPIVFQYSSTGWHGYIPGSGIENGVAEFSLSTDSAGTMVVAYTFDWGYTSPEGYKTVVRKFNGTGFSLIRSFDTYETEPAVAVAKDGTVYFSHFHGDSAAGTYIDKFNGSGWSNVGVVPHMTSLAVDNLGTPYFFERPSSVSTARVLRKYNGSSFVVIADTLSYGQDLAFDSENIPYTITRQGSSVKTIVSKLNSGSWEPVLTTGYAPNSTVFQSLAIGPNDRPHVAYKDSITGKANVKKIDYTVPPISGNVAVCTGSSITLGNTSAGGTWSSSNGAVATIGSSNGIVTAVATGTTTITYAVGSCSATTVVTVGAASGVITGIATACTGGTTTFVNVTTGGVWYSSNTSVATVGSSSGVVGGVAAGTATISYTVSAGCGISTVTKMVTVILTPSVSTITGDPVVCRYATTTLANASPGGIWSNINTEVATVGSATGIVSGLLAGNTMVSYTIANVCGTATATVEVIVNPAPYAGFITGPSSVEEGASITLSSPVSGGTWSADNSNATVSSTGVVSGVTAGTVTISYSVTTSCGTNVATKIITVNLSSILGPSTVTGTGNITLTHATPGGTWSTGCNDIATVSSDGVVTGVSNGITTITYTVGANYTTTVITVNATVSAITGTLTVCAAATTSLGHPVSGGTWNSSNTSVATVDASGIAAGITAGTANITYAYGSGCSSITTITVNGVPSAGTITGTGTICTGGTTTLSNTATGGTWSSSNAGVASINATTGIATGVTTGNATITYTVTGACGTATATATVTVGANTSITGTLSLCAGMTSTLSGSTTGGTWTSGNTAVATIGATSGVLNAVGTGVANITYTLAGGCTATAVATVSMPSIIAGTSNACAGQTATLTDATSGGTWSSSNTSLATVDATTGVVTGIAAGTATVSYVVSAGCYRTIAFTVKALPSAIAGPVTVCAGSTVIVPAPGTTGVSWSSSNTSVATIGSTTGVLAGVVAGTTILTYTTNTGCFVTTEATVTAAPAAITGATALCSGGTSSLGSATSGGTWSSNNTSVATIGSATGVVAAGSTGSATISYNTVGCRITTVVTVSPIAAITGTPAVCAGSSVTLSNTSAGGTWSSSNTGIATVGTSGIVTGVATGNATITYTIASGCTRTVIATVTAAPGAISGSLAACPAATTPLSNSTAGGTWSSGNTTKATINATTGVLTGVAAGTANISYTIGTGCRSIAEVTVNALPAVITGTINACVAQTSTLNNATAGGAWSSNNTGIATIDASGVVTGVSAATTTISYTLGTGCYRTTPFTVKAPPPAIATPVATCVGTSTNIAPPSTNGKSWSSSTTTVATIGSSTGTMTGVSVGTTILTYTATTGCFVTTEATVYALPSAGTITGPTTVIIGNTITLNDAVTGGVWSSSTAKATIGAATGIVTGVAAGSTTISYSVSNPGCTVRATQVVSVTASRSGGSDQFAAGNLQLYPNPTTGAFTVEATEAGTFNIYSLDGREVSNYSIAAGTNQLTLSKELASGIYMCRFTGESGNTMVVRLVYER